MHEISTFKPNTCTTKIDDRKRWISKSNKKEQMLQLAAKTQPYGHKIVIIQIELWLCISVSLEQILLTNNGCMLYQDIISCYISQVDTYNVIYLYSLYHTNERLNVLNAGAFVPRQIHAHVYSHSNPYACFQGNNIAYSRL